MAFGFFSSRAPVVSVLKLHGVIGAGARLSRGLDDGGLADLIERAFKPKRLAAVALSINSPGGSPTQSALIAARIRDHAAERQTPVLAFCEDVAASGGYWLACAADEIFAVETSALGSIGVISASFGLDQAIERLGVERRVQTAGAVKSRLDPFQPLKPEDQEWLAGLQTTIHEEFIAYVKRSRGDRLADPSSAPVGDQRAASLFSGEVFLGEEAVRLGLADGLGRLKPTIKARFGEKTNIEVVTPKRGFFDRFTPRLAAPAPMAEAGGGFAGAAVAAALDELERRAVWARFGL